MCTEEEIVQGITATAVVAARCQKPLLSCVIIPGNPGACGYYQAFADTLFRSSGKRINVFVVSHAGHAPVKEQAIDDNVKSENPKGIKSQTDWFNLADQIDHHIAVVGQLVPASEKLVLVGHSLGSWLITRILPQLSSYDVVRVFHLFPALCHIGDSPNGRALSPFFGSYQWVAHWLLFFVNLLPSFVTDFAISWHLSRSPDSCRSHMVCVTKKLLLSRVLRNCLSLANEEMRTIVDLDVDVLRAFNSKTVYICAENDGWFPLDFVRELQEKVPGADVKLVTDIEHAFVLEKSEEVASMVWERLGKAMEA